MICCLLQLKCDQIFGASQKCHKIERIKERKRERDNRGGKGFRRCRSKWTTHRVKHDYLAHSLAARAVPSWHIANSHTHNAQANKKRSTRRAHNRNHCALEAQTSHPSHDFIIPPSHLSTDSFISFTPPLILPSYLFISFDPNLPKAYLAKTWDLRTPHISRPS